MAATAAALIHVLLMTFSSFVRSRAETLSASKPSATRSRKIREGKDAMPALLVPPP
jgi:hypothetical protein